MEVSVKIKFKPFNTPNYVLEEEPEAPREEGFSRASKTRKFSLSELDANTLSKLCDDFRAEVFKKAGKQQPPTERPA